MAILGGQVLIRISNARPHPLLLSAGLARCGVFNPESPTKWAFRPDLKSG